MTAGRPGQERTGATEEHWLRDQSAHDNASPRLTAAQRGALAHARHLAENGVPLFLMDPKGAPPKNWQRTEPDPAVVDRWRPGLALCAVMGVVVDAVDIDPKNGGDRASLNGLMPRSYGRQTTPNGGTHDLIAPLGVGSPTKVLTGVDIRGGRPDGEGRGFIWLAPTVRRNLAGEMVPYGWEVAPDLDDLALIGGDDTGEALAALVREKPELMPALPAPGEPEREPLPWELDKARAVLAKAVRQVEGAAGHRNETVNRWLFVLYGFVKSGCLDRDAVDEALWDAAQRAESDHPYEREEFAATRRSAWRSARPDRPRLDDFDDDYVEPLPEERVPSPGGVLERYPNLDLAALLDPNRPEREWLLPGLVPAGAQVALIARAGSMKSLLSLALAVAVARGDGEFAGVPIPRQRRVVYADMENPEDELAERFRALGVRAEDMEHLTYLHFPPLPPLDTEEGGRELVAVCEAYGLSAGDLLVLDSLQRVVEGPENDSDTYRAFYRHTMLPLKRLGLTVVRLDNTGKDQSRGSRGSSSKKDDVDVELFVTRDGETLLVGPGKEGKVRMAGIEPLTVDLNTDEDGRLTFTSALDPFRADVNSTVAKMDELGLAWDVGERKAREALTGAKHDVSRRVLRQAVKERKYRADDYRRAPRQEESAHPRRGGESAA